MIGNFEYNNISSESYGLVCKSVNRPILPEIRQNMLEIHGKSGVIDYNSKYYKTRPITMHIAYIGTDYFELRSRSREIAAWLSTGQWAKLIINDEPDKYYWAKVVKGVDFETIKRVGEADIVFECQPFAYLVIDTNADPTWDEADFPWIVDMPWMMVDAYTFTVSGTGGNFEFDNPGTVTIDKSSPQGSKSTIKIVGTWSAFDLKLNGKTLTFAAGSGIMIIDNIDMTVTIDGVNSLSVVDGDIDSFLPIAVGENTIEISGAAINATVTLEFRPQWL